MCYDEEPLLNVGRCGGVPDDAAPFSYRRSFYIQGSLSFVNMNNMSLRNIDVMSSLRCVNISHKCVLPGHVVY